MNPIERQRLVDRYVQILDEGDLDELDPILEAAGRDPELSKMIAAASRGYTEAEGRTLSEVERLQIRGRLRGIVSRVFSDTDGDGSGGGMAGFPGSLPGNRMDDAGPAAQGQSFLRLVVSSSQKRPSQIAPLLNATEEFIDDVNDYPDVAGRNVVLRLVKSAHVECGVDFDEGMYSMEHNPPREAMAASRDDAYDHVTPTFEEILERSQMTEEQKAYWRAVARGEA